MRRGIDAKGNRFTSTFPILQIDSTYVKLKKPLEFLENRVQIIAIRAIFVKNAVYFRNLFFAELYQCFRNEIFDTEF